MNFGGSKGAVDDTAVLHVGGEQSQGLLGGFEPGDVIAIGIFVGA